MQSTSRRRGLNSIGNKMLAALVAVAVLPTVTVAVYAIREASSALVDQALYRLKDNTSSGVRLAQDTLRQLRDELPEIVKQPALLRVNELPLPPTGNVAPSVEESALQEANVDLQRVESLLCDLLRRHRSCATIQLFRVVGSSGMALYRVEPGRPRPEVWCRLNDDLSLKEYRKRPIDEKIDQVLLRTVREAPDRLIHRVTLPAGPGSGDAQELFAARVRNELNHTIAYLIVGLSWSQILQDMVREIALPRSESPDSFRVTLFDRELDPVESLPVNLPFELPESMHSLALAGEAETALTGAGELIAFAPVVPSADESRDNLILSLSRSREHLRHVDQFRYVFSAVLIGALMMALLLGTYLSHRLTRPLRQLRDGARVVGGGDLDLEVRVDTSDEVEEVASEFNAMTTKLRLLYASLEDTIKDRTNQLQHALDELRTTHQNLLDSETRYADIVENASDLIQVTDVEGRIVSSNRRQAQVLGKTDASLVGQRFLDYVAPAVKAETAQAFQSVLDGQTLTAFSSALLAEEGRREVAVEISATPVWRDGVVKGVRAILRDVSERKRFESQLIKAERLSSVGALAAGVAHEINNPLGIITMFAQRALEKARKNEVDVDKLEKILEQTRRVAVITRGLLDFSRAGPTQFQTFELEKTLRDSVALVQERAQRSSIEIHVDVVGPLPMLHGNHQQIGQVLLNLLLNALHAIRNEGRVEIRAERVESSRLPGSIPAVRISVSDTGSGIAVEALPHLFEPFFSTKAPGEGTGLGLSVSYGIIKDHQGIIWAENQGQSGARFQIDLPIPAGARDVTIGVMERARLPTRTGD